MIKIKGQMTRDTLTPWLKGMNMMLGTNIRAGAMIGARMFNANVREYTPVASGEMIAGIGKYDPSYIDDSARPGAHDRARANAIFEVSGSPAHRMRMEYSVSVGTRSKVAFWINYGFFPGGGESYVQGAYMFERGMAKTEKDFKPLLKDVLEQTFRLRDMNKKEFMKGHEQILGKMRRELTRTTVGGRNR